MYLPTAVFTLVILVPVAAAERPLHLGPPGERWSACDAATRPRLQLLVPCALVAVVGALGAGNASLGERDLLAERAGLGRDRRRDLRLRRQLGCVVVRPHQLRRRRRVSRPAVLTAAAGAKAGRTRHPSTRCSATTRLSGVPTSLLLAAAVGGVFALLVGLPLMRLSGLAAGIATFAVLEYHATTSSAQWNAIGPALGDAHGGARDDRAAAGRRSARSSRSPQRSPTSAAGSAACSAPPREDPAAAPRNRRRRAPPAVVGLRAFLGAGGVRGRSVRALPRVHQRPRPVPRPTFLTLAMLVVGGMTSLWGAVARRARCQRARLVPQQGRGRASGGSDLAAGDAPRSPRRDHGARADPAAVGDHGRRGSSRSRGSAPVRAVALAAALVIGLAACGGSDEPKKELLPGTLTVGAVVASARDRVISRGARIDVGEVNSLGGIAGQGSAAVRHGPDAAALVRNGAKALLLRASRPTRRAPRRRCAAGTSSCCDVQQPRRHAGVGRRSDPRRPRRRRSRPRSTTARSSRWRSFPGRPRSRCDAQ